MATTKSKSTKRSVQVLPFTTNTEFLSEYKEMLVALCHKNRAIASSEEDDDDFGEKSYKRRVRENAPRSSPSDAKEAASSYDLKCVELKARIDATVAADTLRLPLIEISREYGLSDIEESVLVSILFYNNDRSFERKLDSISNQSHPSVRTFVSLFGEDPEGRQRVRALFLRTGNLMKYGLLDAMRWNHMSEDDFLNHHLEVPLSISNLVLGESAELESEVDCVKVVQPACSLDDLILPESRKTEIVEAARGGLILLHGKPGSGKSSIAESIAASRGSRLMVVRTPEYLNGPCEDRPYIVMTLKQARLHKAVIVFENADRLLDPDPDETMIEDFSEEFSSFDGTVILTSRSEPDQACLMAQQADYIIGLEVPEPEDREALWRRFLPEGTAFGPDVDLKAISQNLALTGGQIRRIALQMQKRAALRPEGQRQITLADLSRSQCNPRIGQVSANSPSSVITPTVSLSDVILPEGLRSSVEEIVKAAGSREKVLNSWGFGTHYSTGHGIAALFYGESGTGKTLTAEAVAGELKKPLRMIQLSGMMSKYVGDTEKRIVEVFRSASESNEILLADEADSLFAARISSNEHHAYYINNHINCLLSEMDRFSGIVILSSNRALALDEAFERRIGWKLEFPKPNVELRENLWRKLVPSTAPLADDIDFSVLAHDYDFTGGLIRQVLLKAAYVAAAENTPISLNHIRQAARTEKLNGMTSQNATSSMGFRVAV